MGYLELTTVKAQVSNLREDMDYLKFTDFPSLFKVEESQCVPRSFEVPLTTIGYFPNDDVIVGESKTEIDDDQLTERDEASYDNLIELKDLCLRLPKLLI